jgi:hypothetical protein
MFAVFGQKYITHAALAQQLDNPKAVFNDRFHVPILAKEGNSGNRLTRYA